MTIEEIDRMLDAKACLNEAIFNSFVKASNIINSIKYKSIICSISGGSDSDIILDICTKVDKNKKIKYVWFNTGLEYQATKDHLTYLENKYGIEIKRERAIKSIPLSCKEYGQPFVSKYVSEQIMRLQSINFQWENEPFEILKKKYKECHSAIKWWTNYYTQENGFEKVSRYDIDYNKHLKEFILENPTDFNISHICCKYAKKDVSKELKKRYNADLEIIGVRRAEGGIRAQAYKNCYSDNSAEGRTSQFRPIFYYTDDDKKEYEKIFDIKHSDCYLKYGMTRTGCAGCPYNRNIDKELHVIKNYEPMLFSAIQTVFSNSYEYTKKYHEFCNKKKQISGQMSFFDE